MDSALQLLSQFERRELIKVSCLLFYLTFVYQEIKVANAGQ